jgi:sugar lactone lactonase YvrE
MIKQLIAITLLLGMPAVAQNPFEIFSQSQQSLSRGDTAAYLTHAKQARDMAPFDLWFSANLARAYAMNNQKIRCIEILDDLSVLGFDFDVLNDEGFKKIRTHSLLTEITKRATKNIPKENGVLAMTIPEKNLIVKGITYDPRRNTFYAGSIHQRKIVSILPDGSVRDAVSEAAEGLLSPVAVKVDAARNHLWVLDVMRSSGARLHDSAMTGASRLRQYDLESMRLVRTYTAADTLEHFYNDLVILRNGDIFITDSRNGSIYTLNRTNNALEPWYDRNDMYYPNGIAVSADQKYLFVSHWQGISRISVAGKQSQLMTAKVKTTLTGIDGLYFYNDGLIAVQNSAGPQSRIMRYDLGKNYDTVTKATIMESGHHLHNIPTTGVIVGEDFYYVANSQLQNFDVNGTIFPPDRLQPTYILKIPLTGK